MYMAYVHIDLYNLAKVMTTKKWSKEKVFLKGNSTNSIYTCHKVNSGAVLLEYVIVTSFMLFAFVGGATALFRPPGSISADASHSLGLLGDTFFNVYQQIICGLGLPFP